MKQNLKMARRWYKTAAKSGKPKAVLTTILHLNLLVVSSVVRAVYAMTFPL